MFYLRLYSYWYEGTEDYYELRELYASISQLQVCPILYSIIILTFL